MPESERLKVTALNLFHPTATTPSEKSVFGCCDPASEGGGEGGGGPVMFFLVNIKVNF